MRRFLFLLSALVFTLTLAFFPGCGGDDNPTDDGNGGSDTLTTEEVLTTLEDLGGAFNAVYDDCGATYIVNGLLNGSGASVLFFQILLNALSDDPENDFSDFYGTWDLDTTTISPIDMILVDADPTDAVQINVMGVDTLGGGNYPGDITLYDFVLGQDLDTFYVHAALHEYSSGDSMALTLVGSLNSGMLSISGNACALTFLVSAEVSQTDTSTVSGWYDYPGDPKVYFSMTGILDADTTVSEANVHIWTTQAPTVDISVTFTDNPASCVTGEIKINGHTEATIYAENCDAETVDVYVLIDGQVFTLEDLIGDFYQLILGIDPNSLPGGALKQAFSFTPIVGKSEITRFQRLAR